VLGAAPLLTPLLEGSVADPARMPMRLVARYLAPFVGREGVAHLLALARTITREDFESIALESVRAPTLVVRSEGDRWVDADIAKRLGRSSKIVHAIAAHHGEEEPQTVEAFIVATADAISGARPGARREMVETYIKRLEALEGVANSFEGVEKSFAIQAGREVRILVHPTAIDDLGASRLARDVSRKIEESLEYPGQIKVTVIRETRAVDYAR